MSSIRNNIKRNLTFRKIFTSVFSTLLFIIVLFIAAGDLGWHLGWIFTVISLVSSVLSLIFFDPELLEERSRPGSDYKRWDYPLAIIAGRLGPLTTLLIAGLDYRFGWSGTLPAAVPVSGFYFTHRRFHYHILGDEPEQVLLQRGAYPERTRTPCSHDRAI